MKRIQLIEWGLIAIALIFGYKFFEGMISLVLQIIASIMTDRDQWGAAGGLIGTFVYLIIYVAILFGLIRYSRPIAAYLNGPANGDDTVPVKIGKKALLQVILITLGAITVLTEAADIVYYIFAIFKQDVSGNRDTDLNSLLLTKSQSVIVPLIISCIQVILAIIVISKANKIASAIVPKNELDELTFDSKPEN